MLSGAIPQTYIDGRTIVSGPSSNQKPPASSAYVNNYMGSALPARRKLVTMDTLGRLIQRRSPWRPLSGVNRTPAEVSARNQRAHSAPATGVRTSGDGELFIVQDVAENCHF